MGIRIDALDAAASAQADHEIPAMRSGATVKLTAQQLATFIIAIVTDSAPATLDTLNELAAALGNDPNFATTVTTALSARLEKSQNLADLANVGTARSNLSFPSTLTGNTALVRNAGNTAYDQFTKAQFKAWLDPAPDYTSAEQSLTADTNIDLAHGLGALPSRWSVVLRCKTADLGYAVGTEIPIGSHVTHTAQSDQGAVVGADATNIYIVQGNALYLLSRTTNNNAILTPGNWRWVARAWI